MKPTPCAEVTGRVIPVINRNRCEAKGPCVAVCPYHVFEIAPLSSDQRAGLTLMGRLKSIVHGGKQAMVVRGDDCHACGLCVPACPEGAITLERLPATPPAPGNTHL